MDHLRPTKMSEFMGQEPMKERLQRNLTSARTMNRPLDHVLLYGPPGFGKTTLAGIIAGELDKRLVELNMPVTTRALTELIRNDPNALIFLDEIHAAPKAFQEALYPLLEFGYMENDAGLRVHGKGVTLIAATTEREKVLMPLWDKFPIKPVITDYSDEEMGAIVLSMAAKAGMEMSVDTAEALGRATGGTPRKAKDFVLSARDLIMTGTLHPTADEILDQCQVDPTGLTVQHLDYLTALDECGGQAGLPTIKAMLRVNEGVIREIERMLQKQKLIRFTKGGRTLTREGQIKVEGKAA